MVMLKKIIGILVLTVLSVLPSCTATKSVQEASTGENLIIYYSPETGNKELLKAAKKYGSKVIYVYQNINGIAVTVPKGKTVQEAMKYYDSINGVLSIVKDQKMRLDFPD